MNVAVDRWRITIVDPSSRYNLDQETHVPGFLVFIAFSHWSGRGNCRLGQFSKLATVCAACSVYSREKHYAVYNIVRRMER
jgi:hypothetical protein